jgi:hypothetical protein
MTRVWREDLSGQLFGRLEVVAEVDRINGRRMWMCRCVCNAELNVEHRSLKSGNTKSCGCLYSDARTEVHKTHGQGGPNRTRAYRIWSNMLTRCRNPLADNYERYGGRGISVCERWLKFEHFFEDMGSPPAGTSIDRIENSGNYEPGNCRWATTQQQNENRRGLRWVEYDGKKMLVSQWAKHLGVNPSTLYEALDKHPIEYALRDRSGSK